MKTTGYIISEIRRAESLRHKILSGDYGDPRRMLKIGGKNKTAKMHQIHRLYIYCEKLLKSYAEEAEQEGIERGKIIERHGCESWIE